MRSVPPLSLRAIIPSFKGFQGNLERGVGPEMDRAGKSGGDRFGAAAGAAAGGRFKATFGKAAKAALLGVGALGVGAIKLAGDSVKLASDLNESLNAVNVSYGKQAKAVKALGRDAATSLGLSNTEFNALSVRFSAFSKTIAGGPGKKVVKTLDDLTTRAADFASVMNLEVNEAAELFQSGLAGETEPLRKYGVDLSAAAVEAHAVAEGIAEATKNTTEIKRANLDALVAQREYNETVKEHGRNSLEAKDAALDLKDAQEKVKEATRGSVAELSEAEKVQARYSLLMKQTGQTAGDFANTSDSLANRQRILNARWDDARAKLGKALLPTMERVSGWVLDVGLPAFERFGDWFATDGIDQIGEFARFVKTDVVPPLKTAAGWAEDFAGFLNDLPKSVKIGGLAGLAALVGGSKLRAGGGGALGSAGKVLGLAKPVPVLVMNKGFGPGGVPGAGGGTAKTPPVVAGGGNQALKGATRGSRFLKFAPLLPAAGALGNDQLPDLMTDKQAADFKRYQANIERSTEFWLDHERRLRTGTIPTVDATFNKFRDLFGAVDKVDKKDPKINLFLDGYGDINAKLSKLEGDLNWVARPRYIRMTITRDFDTMDGRRSMPGLQERASGGHMSGGTPYLVGERGPEVFTPYGGGRMTANHQLGGDGGRIVIEIDGEQFDARVRRVADGRVDAGARHRRITGRR